VLEEAGGGGVSSTARSFSGLLGVVAKAAGAGQASRKDLGAHFTCFTGVQKDKY
jgi:hypothetical protein